MSPRSIVIVGAGPAGLATARSYRRHGGEAKVTMLGAERKVPYQRPPLTKEFLRGEAGGEALPIEPPSWFQEYDVELRLGAEVSAIDPDEGHVAAGDETFQADAIVLATGAAPVRPDIPGLDHPDLQTMRECADSERIAARAQAGSTAVVLGAGFIGCEIAASLALMGAEVTLIGKEPAPQQERLGSEAAARIASWLAELGVRMRMGTSVRAVREGSLAELDDGGSVEAQSIVLAMGVRPRGELAADAGLELRDGAIPTDAQMRAHPRVLAAGDVAFAHNRRAGRPLRVEHWGDALGQGEVAGRVLAGQDACWEDVPGFWSAIGPHTLKHAAWGDGYDSCRLQEHADGAFTVCYRQESELVGVLTHERDEDYERGRQLIEAGGSA